MAASNEICFGPFVIHHEPERDYPNFQATSLALEFATSGRTMSHIYRRVTEEGRSLASWGLHQFFIHESELPCDVRTGLPMSVHDGIMVPLDEVLLALCRKFSSARPPRAFLEELRSQLGPEEGEARPNLLRQDAASAGFRTSKGSFAFGRTLSIQIEWVPLVDLHKRSACSVSLGYVEFRPEPNRTLGKGKWVEPACDLLGMIFRTELKKLVKGPPVAIFSDEGIATLVAEFPWKPISLLTWKELQEAKVTFIREHHELHSAPAILAKAMIEAGLYSEGTDVTTVKQFVIKALDKLRVE